MIAFKNSYVIGYPLFGIHLAIIGVLVWKSKYVPTLFGPLLIITGVGYITHSLGTYVLPGVDLGFVMLTFFGELFFFIWLLFWGARIKSLGFDKNAERPSKWMGAPT